MPIIEALLPAGLSRFNAWRKKFQALGLGELAAMRAASSVAHKRAYDQAKLEHLPESVRTRLRCVVDVGANEGQWSSALLMLAQPERLELFEPNPEAFERLRARIVPNGKTGIYPHAFALGEEPGELTLNVMQRSDFSSFLAPAAAIREHYAGGAGEIARQVQVRVETLDRVLADLTTIDLLKLDVQGFERKVLAGATVTLRRTRALLIEANFVSHYVADDTFGALTELLKNAGLELWDLSPPFRASNGRALWCDAVFVQPRLL